MIRILKNKKGMTLVELIAAMLMFTIIATSVSVIVAPTLRVYAKANELAECNTLLDNVANQIIDDLSGATRMDTAAPATDNVIAFWAGDSYIKYTVETDPDSVNHGVLLKSSAPGEPGAPVLSKDFYKNKSISFPPLEEISPGAYTLEIVVSSDSDGEMIRREYAVRPIALNPYAPS